MTGSDARAMLVNAACLGQQNAKGKCPDERLADWLKEAGDMLASEIARLTRERDAAVAGLRLLIAVHTREPWTEIKDDEGWRAAAAKQGVTPALERFAPTTNRP